jgi:copper(I)-binding protein
MEEALMKISLTSVMMLVSLAIAFALPASAHEEVAGKLRIGHPWVKAAPEGAPDTYACVIEIKNEGDEPDRLLGATLEGIGPGVIYKIVEKDGKFTSHKVEDGLLIKAHGSLELTPTTYQIRFGKVTKALEEGEHAIGTLVFEKQKNVPVHFMVEPDDTAPQEEASSEAAHHEHKDHSHH